MAMETTSAMVTEVEGGGDTLEYDIHQLDSPGRAFSGFAADLKVIGAVVGQVIAPRIHERGGCP